MTDPDLERLLTEALGDRAERAVPSTRPVPPMVDPHRTHTAVAKRNRWAPLASAAAVIAVVGVVLAVQSGGGHHRSTATSNTPTGTATQLSTSSFAADRGATPVDMTFNLPTQSVGVGMPVIASFTSAITDARALQAATHATVNGKPIDLAWYFVRPSLPVTAPMIGVLRAMNYWPAHASIRIALDVAGLSAGHGLGFRTSSTLTFKTGAADIATVDADTHTMTVVRDGNRIGSYPVSLGVAVAAPTKRGIKIITEKFPTICLSVPGSANQCGIKYAQRIATNEYLLAAPWNVANIGVTNTSAGSTDLLPKDAQTLFATLQIGDVVSYPNANGPVTSAAESGYWNVSWSTWQTGGLVPTH